MRCRAAAKSSECATGVEGRQGEYAIEKGAEKNLSYNRAHQSFSVGIDKRKGKHQPIKIAYGEAFPSALQICLKMRAV